jgi:hypothetical protein
MINDAFRVRVKVDYDKITSRNIQDSIKYVTRKDCECLYHNVTTEQFSTYWRVINEYCIYNKEWKEDHPFIFEIKLKGQHHVSAAYRLWKEYMRSNTVLRPHRPITNIAFTSWQAEVVTWYNNFVGTPYHDKKPQLYLWGESDCGKSRFIKYLFSEFLNFKIIFLIYF